MLFTLLHCPDWFLHFPRARPTLPHLWALVTLLCTHYTHFSVSPLLFCRKPSLAITGNGDLPSFEVPRQSGAVQQVWDSKLNSSVHEEVNEKNSQKSELLGLSFALEL